MTFGTLSSSLSSGGPPIGGPLPPDASPGAGCSKGLPGSCIARRGRPVIPASPTVTARQVRAHRPPNSFQRNRASGAGAGDPGKEHRFRDETPPRREPGPFRDRAARGDAAARNTAATRGKDERRQGAVARHP